MSTSELSINTFAAGKQRLHYRITRFLALEILRGAVRFEPNETTRESDLCQQLGVSRTALRESLKVLAAKGLVDLRPKVGVRIRPREDWNLLDPDVLAWQHEAGVDDNFVRNLCEVRLIVETAAAELAAERATEEDRLAIRSSLETMKRSLDVKEKKEYDKADLAFHNAIFIASRNELLARMGTTIGEAMSSTQRWLMNVSPADSIDLHEAIGESICDGDGMSARAFARRLITQASKGLYQAIHPEPPAARKKG